MVTCKRVICVWYIKVKRGSLHSVVQQFSNQSDQMYAMALGISTKMLLLSK